MLILAWPAAAQDKGAPHRVLVLHSFRNSLPVNADWHNGLVRGFSSAPDLLVEIDTEAPDLSHFMGTDYVGDLLVHGEDLFPGVPICSFGLTAASLPLSNCHRK